MAALTTVPTTSRNTRAAGTAAEVGSRPAPTDDRSVLETFTDSAAFSAVKDATTAVIDKGEAVISKPIQQLKELVDDLMGYVGLNLTMDLGRRADRDRARRKSQRDEAYRDSMIADSLKVSANAEAEGTFQRKRQRAAA